MSKRAGMVLVTGASGFVGRALCQELTARGEAVRGAVRANAGAGQIAVGNLDGSTDWRAALQGCEVVIHLAARVHVMADTVADPMSAYREVNVAATLQLARQAHAAGVRRFVFVSSIKVNGEATTAQPYRASDVPAPVDPYGQSKLEAETALRQLCADTGMELVIVRPPLVYGPGVKANFAGLLRLVKLGVPLPMGLVNNRRSMVSLGNLVDLLIVCADHPAAAGQVFLISDGADASVADLIRMIGKGLGKRVLLLPLPVGLMSAGARLLGKSALAERLFGSLQVDIEPTCRTLGWIPPQSMQEGIDRTAQHYIAQLQGTHR